MSLEKDTERESRQLSEWRMSKSLVLNNKMNEALANELDIPMIT